VPVPERNKTRSLIRGNLYTETRLKNMFEQAGFGFFPCDFENGVLLYFKAVKNGNSQITE